MISTIQRYDGTEVVSLPLAQRPGVIIPTPENLQAVADKAAAKRARTAAEITPQEFGAQYGIPRDFALFMQRLEGRVIELENRVAQLEAAEKSRVPRHLRDVEKR